MRAAIGTSLFIAVALVSAPYAFAQGGSGVFNEYANQPEVTETVRPTPGTVDSKGDLNLSVPVLTVPGRGIDVPITLSYNSAVSTRSQASWVGLGWSYNPGSITRDVKGGIFTGSGANGVVDHNVDVSDDLTYTHVNPNGISVTMGYAEWAPDAYQLSFPGGGGTLMQVNGKDGNQQWVDPCPNTDCAVDIGTWDFMTLERKPWKIEAYAAPSVNVNGEVSGVYGGAVKPDFYRFVVTTEDGTRYVYEHPTLTSFNGLETTSLIVPETLYHVGSWRLKAILGPTFTDPLPNPPTGQYIANNHAATQWPADDAPGAWVRFEYGGVGTYEDLGGSWETLRQYRYLSRIVTPTHVAEFASGAGGGGNWTALEDQATALTQIVLKSRLGGSEQIVRTVSLNGTVQNGGVGMGISRNERRLDEIEFTGHNGSTTASGGKYIFDYYSANSGGTPNPSFYNTDFPNDPATVDQFGFYREDEPGVTLDPWSWSLKDVTYPTGARESFVYESDNITAPVSIKYGAVGGAVTAPVGGTNFYTLTTAKDKKQGGARVKERVSSDSLGGVHTTTYTYGTGRLSGIPSYFWRQDQDTRDMFYPGDNGEAGVYYDTVTRHYADGSKVTTEYSQSEETPLTPRYVEQVFNAQHKAVLSTSEAWIWGIPIEVTETSGDNRPMRRQSTELDFITNLDRDPQGSPGYFSPFQLYPQIGSLPSGQETLKSDWVEVQRPFEHGLVYDDRGGSIATASTLRTYDSRTGLVSQTKVSQDVGDSTTNITRAWELAASKGGVFQDMLERNMLTAPVLERVSATDAPQASTVTTYASFDPGLEDYSDSVMGNGCSSVFLCMFLPHRTYAYRGTDTQITVVGTDDFGAWSITQKPSNDWIGRSTVLAYNGDGNPTKVEDTAPLTTQRYAGLEVELFYGGNTTSTSFNRASTTLERAFLTGVRTVADGTTLQQEYQYDLRTAQISRSEDENDDARTFTYDPLGRLYQTKNTSGLVTSQSTYGFLTSSTAPNWVQTGTYDGSKWSYTKTFADGWGRPVQTQTQESGSTYIVTATEYDLHGRAVTEYLPFTQSTSGNYRTPSQISSQAVSVYGGAYRPKTVTQYEPSPSGRVVRVYNPSQTISDTTSVAYRYAVTNYDDNSIETPPPPPPGGGSGSSATASPPGPIGMPTPISPPGSAPGTPLPSPGTPLPGGPGGPGGIALLDVPVNERMRLRTTAIDEVGNHVQVYSNTAGDPVLERRVIDSIPGTATLTTNAYAENSASGASVGFGTPPPSAIGSDPGSGSVSSGRRGRRVEQADTTSSRATDLRPLVPNVSGTSVPGDVTLLAEEGDQDEDIATFTASTTHTVTWEAEVETAGTGYGEFSIKESGTNATKAYTTGLGSGSFTAVSGRTYTVKSYATTSGTGIAFASAQGTVTYQQGGNIDYSLDTETTYDGMGRVVRTQTPEGKVSAYKYDRLGQLVAVVTPEADGDGDGDPTNETLGGEPDIEYAYDDAGRLRFTRDARQRVAGSLYYTRYDGFGRATQQGRMSYPGNAFTNPATINNQGWPTSWRSETTNYEYDTSNPSYAHSGLTIENPKNRLVQVRWNGGYSGQSTTLPNSGFNHFSYDNEGNIKGFRTEISGLAGKLMTFTYDRQNRMQTTTYQAGQSDRHYWHQSYDTAGRAYWLRGNATNMSTGSGVYDISRSFYNSKAREYSRTTLSTFSNALTQDIRGRLTASATTRYGTPVYSTNLEYAANSLIESVVSDSPQHPSSGYDRYRYAFEYDRAGRLLEGIYQRPYYSNWINQNTYNLEEVVYDGDGNIVSLDRRTPSGLDALEYEQVTGAGGAASGRIAHVMEGSSTYADFTYDANGAATAVTSPISGAGQYYRDAFYHRTGHLYELKPGPTSTTRIRYLYDPNGQRVYTSASGGRYDIRGPGGNIVASYSGTGAFLHHDLGAAGKREVGGTRVGYIADHLGSVRVAMTTSGSVRSAVDYYPFGMEMPNRVYNSTPDVLDGYTGHQLDAETGMNYAGARYYMPALGRWTSTDPMEQYPSPYVYSGNNPVSFVDPDGMFASPIYDEEGEFLGTDDEGLQGDAIVMRREDFRQGMSHRNAMNKSLGAEGLSSNTARIKLDVHYASLSSRPDYDGFVTMEEGIAWARANPGALNDPTPNNSLYVDASLLDLGNTSRRDFLDTNTSTAINMFNASNVALAVLPGEGRLRDTIYALGRINMILHNRTSGEVSIINNEAAIYDWNPGGGFVRNLAIRAERYDKRIKGEQGFMVNYYGRARIRPNF